MYDKTPYMPRSRLKYIGLTPEEPFTRLLIVGEIALVTVAFLKCSLGFGLLGYYSMWKSENVIVQCILAIYITVACLLFGLLRLYMASMAKEFPEDRKRRKSFKQQSL